MKPIHCSTGETITEDQSYSDYLETDHWQSMRIRVRNKYNSTCHCCALQATPDTYHCFSVHHITYARLGNEKLPDLVYVCQECHELIHRLQDQLRGQGKCRKAVEDATRVMRRRSKHCRRKQRKKTSTSKSKKTQKAKLPPKPTNRPIVTVLPVPQNLRNGFYIVGKQEEPVQGGYVKVTFLLGNPHRKQDFRLQP